VQIQPQPETGSIMRKDSGTGVKNKRRSERRKVTVAIPVTNALTGRIAGQLVNVSVDGLMLVSSHAIADDSLHQFDFTLPGMRGTSRRMQVGVHEQWSEPASTPGQFWLGFNIIDISPDDEVALDAWVHDSAVSAALT
jgi:hypothetical protein